MFVNITNNILSIIIYLSFTPVVSNIAINIHKMIYIIEKI